MVAAALAMQTAMFQLKGIVFHEKQNIDWGIDNGKCLCYIKNRIGREVKKVMKGGNVVIFVYL